MPGGGRGSYSRLTRRVQALAAPPAISGSAPRSGHVRRRSRGYRSAELKVYRICAASEWACRICITASAFRSRGNNDIRIVRTLHACQSTLR